MPSTLPPHIENAIGINQIAFRQDGTQVAYADTVLTIEVRSEDDLLWQRNFATHDPEAKTKERVRGIAYSPSGDVLYAITGNRLVALNAETGQEIWSYAAPRSFGFLLTSPTAIAISPNESMVAAFDNGAIGIWDGHGSLLGLWKDIDLQRHLAFLPNGNLLGDDSFGLNIFDPVRCKRIRRISLRERAFGIATAPATSPLNGRIAVRTLHEVLQIDDEGTILARNAVEPGLPLLAFHPHLPLIAQAGAQSVSFCDALGSLVHREEITDARVVSLQFSPSGVLAVGCSDRSVRFVEPVVDVAALPI